MTNFAYLFEYLSQVLMILQKLALKTLRLKEENAGNQ